VDELLDIMRRLRDPQSGCAWDLAQDFASIAPYTIEEAYEVADVIEREAWDELPGELGDLLRQVVFHAQMADEAGRFAFGDVAQAISAKLVRRHPHVFAGRDFASDAERSAAWEADKAGERAARGARSLMDGVPRGMPELLRARKLQKRAAQAGFDWPDAAPVLDKLREETLEIEQAMLMGDAVHIEEELGDLLFAVVNLARKLRLDPGRALRRANAKFEARYRAMEQQAGGSEAFAQLDLGQQEAMWQAVKQRQGADGETKDD
jgi:ATP diphosphatase